MHTDVRRVFAQESVKQWRFRGEMDSDLNTSHSRWSTGKTRVSSPCTQACVEIFKQESSFHEVKALSGHLTMNMNNKVNEQSVELWILA